MEEGLLSVQDVREFCDLKESKVSFIINVLQNPVIKTFYKQANLKIAHLLEFTETELINFTTVFSTAGLYPHALECIESIKSGLVPSITTAKPLRATFSEGITRILHALQLPAIKSLFISGIFQPSHLLRYSLEELKTAAEVSCEPNVYRFVETRWISAWTLLEESPERVRSIANSLQQRAEQLQLYISKKIFSARQLASNCARVGEVNVKYFLSVICDDKVIQLLEDKFIPLESLCFYYLIDPILRGGNQNISYLHQLHELIYDQRVTPLLNGGLKGIKLAEDPVYLILRNITLFSLEVVKIWLFNANVKKAVLNGLVSLKEFLRLADIPIEAALVQKKEEMLALIQALSHPLIMPCVESKELKEYRQRYDAEQSINRYSDLPTPLHYLQAVYLITQSPNLRYYFSHGLLSAQDIVNECKGREERIHSIIGYRLEQFHKMALVRFLQKTLTILQEKIAAFEKSSYSWTCPYLKELQQSLENAIPSLKVMKPDEVADFVSSEKTDCKLSTLLNWLKLAGESLNPACKSEWRNYCKQQFSALQVLFTNIKNRAFCLNTYLGNQHQEQSIEIAKLFKHLSIFKKPKFYPNWLPSELRVETLKYVLNEVDSNASMAPPLLAKKNSLCCAYP